MNAETVLVMIARVRRIRAALEERMVDGPSLGFAIPRIPAQEPDLAALLREPDRVAEVTRESIPKLLGDLRRLEVHLLARFLNGAQTKHEAEAVKEDHLLNVREAATMLRVSTDWLYRNAKTLPFTLRVGSRVRFSSQGVDRFIRQRSGGQAGTGRGGASSRLASEAAARVRGKLTMREGHTE